MSLYPEGAHWCSRADYDVVLNTAKRLNAKRVLEFGPGTTTLALIEAGVEHIDACEDDEHWFGVWSERLAKYPAVHMHMYQLRHGMTIPGVSGWYDLAVIDGPKETRRRDVSIFFAMVRATNVIVALEEHDAEPYLRRVIERNRVNRSVEIIESGPLAGAYALIGPP